MAGSKTTIETSRPALLLNGNLADFGAELTGHAAGSRRRLPRLTIDPGGEAMQAGDDRENHSPIAPWGGSQLDRPPIGEISRQLDRASARCPKQDLASG